VKPRFFKPRFFKPRFIKTSFIKRRLAKIRFAELCLTELSLTELSLATLNRTALTIKPLKITAFNSKLRCITAFAITTLGINTLSIITLSIITLSVTTPVAAAEPASTNHWQWQTSVGVQHIELPYRDQSAQLWPIIGLDARYQAWTFSLQPHQLVQYDTDLWSMPVKLSTGVRQLGLPKPDRFRTLRQRHFWQGFSYHPYEWVYGITLGPEWLNLNIEHAPRLNDSAPSSGIALSRRYQANSYQDNLIATASGQLPIWQSSPSSAAASAIQVALQLQASYVAAGAAQLSIGVSDFQAKPAVGRTAYQASAYWQHQFAVQSVITLPWLAGWFSAQESGQNPWLLVINVAYLTMEGQPSPLLASSHDRTSNSVVMPMPIAIAQTTADAACTAPCPFAQTGQTDWHGWQAMMLLSRRF
jgi:hypothetical protein